MLERFYLSHMKGEMNVETLQSQKHKKGAKKSAKKSVKKSVKK
jgi:hypothetical protein